MHFNANVRAPPQRPTTHAPPFPLPPSKPLTMRLTFVNRLQFSCFCSMSACVVVMILCALHRHTFKIIYRNKKRKEESEKKHIELCALLHSLSLSFSLQHRRYQKCNTLKVGEFALRYECKNRKMVMGTRVGHTAQSTNTHR